MERTSTRTRMSWAALSVAAIILIGTATANATGDLQPDGETMPPLTTLPAEEVQKLRKTYEIWIAILDDTAVVDGTLYEQAALESARVSLDGRCAEGRSSEVGEIMPATDAGAAANSVLATIDCDVSTMSVKIQSNGQVTV